MVVMVRVVSAAGAGLVAEWRLVGAGLGRVVLCGLGTDGLEETCCLSVDGLRFFFF